MGPSNSLRQALSKGITVTTRLYLSRVPSVLCSVLISLPLVQPQIKKSCKFDPQAVLSAIKACGTPIPMGDANNVT